MRLLKAEHNEKGIKYFTNSNQAAKYINSSITYIKMQIAGISKSVKGWKFEWTEDPSIINKNIIG